MIRATELGGRAVVDMEAAEKLGRIDRVVLDPDNRRVAGLVVSQGSSIFNNGTQITLPASSVHAIGPDAVTVRRAGGAATTDVAADGPGRFDGLPRASDVIGRKVVSEGGRFLGRVDDVLIDEMDGRIIGYALDEYEPRERDTAGFREKVDQMMSGDRHGRRSPYLRADANLRAGDELIVAPEDAVSFDWPDTRATVESLPPGASMPAARWSDSAPAGGASQWIRREPADRTPVIGGGGDL